MRRRRFLRESTLGTVAGASIAWGSCISRTNPTDQDDGDQPTEPERADFLWLHGRLLEDTKVRENLFAFASRHDLAVILRVGLPRGDRTAADLLREPLGTAREFGVTTWLAAGVLEYTTAETFVTVAEERRTHERRLAELVTLYDELSDGGRVILWEEAPIAGRWTPDGAWTDAAIENLRDHGAEIFAAQRQVVKDVNPNLDVGIFVHFVYIVDSKRPEMFATLMDGLRERGALPDFTFTDFYRGNYEKDIGPTKTNRTVRSLITNARNQTDGNPVYYLASPHTINPKYTVSKQSIRMDIRAAQAVAVDGLGWYSRTAYHQTEQGFDPYVPNTAPADAIHGDELGTFTVARDRFLYAYAASLGTLSTYDPSSKFDLWIQGRNLGFHDHRLWARGADDEWRLLGDVAGYRDGEYEYSTAAGEHVAIFHALDRDTFIGQDGLDVKLETDAGADDAELTGAWLLPFDPAGYVTEHVATDIADDRQLAEFAFGEWSGVQALEPGEDTRISIPASQELQRDSLASLAFPEHRDISRRLREREADEDFDPAGLFDLWVLGSNLEGTAGPGFDFQVESDGHVHSVARESHATNASDEAIVFYGVERDPFVDAIEEASGEIRSRDNATSIRALYAMPYFGSGNVKGPREIVRLVDGNPDGARVFSDTHWIEREG